MPKEESRAKQRLVKIKEEGGNLSNKIRDLGIKIKGAFQRKAITKSLLSRIERSWESKGKTMNEYIKNDIKETINNFLSGVGDKREALIIARRILKIYKKPLIRYCVDELRSISESAKSLSIDGRKSLLDVAVNVVENTSGYSMGVAFHFLDSLLRNPNFLKYHSHLLPLLKTIAKNTSGYATTYAFSSLSSLLENPNFQPSWLTNYFLPTFNKIAKNTSGYVTEYTFSSLSSLLENPNFQPSWLNEEFALQLSKIANTIAEKTSGNAMEGAFDYLNSLLKNPNFPKYNPQLLSFLKTIANNTSGNAMEGAFNSLNSLLNNPNFQPSWLNEEFALQLSKVANTIANNTSGYAMEGAFNSLNSLLNNPNFPKYNPQLLSLLKTIAENTPEDAT